MARRRIAANDAGWRLARLATALAAASACSLRRNATTSSGDIRLTFPVTKPQ